MRIDDEELYLARESLHRSGRSHRSAIWPRRAWILGFGMAAVLAQSSSAHAGDAFVDKDEGITGPLQNQFENKIIFAHEFIERSESDPKKVISQTTLKEPIFVRYYRSRTPARILHDQGQDGCFGTQRYDKTFAYLEGHQQERVLVNEASFGDQSFNSSRSSSITIGEKESLLPLARLNVTLAEQEQKAFLSLVGSMMPGENKVIFENFIGCQEIAKDDKPVSTGMLTFVVKKGDVAAYAKRVGPEMDPGSADRATQARVEALFRKSMTKGAKIIKLVTDSTETEPMESQTTPVRAFLRNVEGTCSYVEGWWRQKYMGGGKFDSGGFDAGLIKGFGDQLSVPCPG
ncbi:MAG: hypothetical protein A2289_11325 [Deltaproteobacteria bacterium RIFOXYA12_FULL_58_15]|nr:MAG: hypothetical protein A2289_11325 [Deltaproteobacteria bacterium RIFOXYA12_FULL_58_15]